MKHLSDRVYCIALASLLHDIGKPLQRANRNDKSTLQTEGAKSMERADLVKYSHALWTSEFIFRNKEKFLELAPVRNYGFEKFQKCASKHHKPDSDCVDEMIMQRADCASAGSDRFYVENDDHDDLGRNRYISEPLVSIFTRVELDGIRSKSKHYDLGNLDSNAIIPGSDIKLSSEKYKSLMDNFEYSFKRIPTQNSAVFLDALITIVTRYLWCVPSSTIDGYADIPLSDHNITTAAIASAMAVACEQTNCGPEKSRYLLVSGDFSGIQKFIFSLSGESNRNIAALLRGRSFMVNLYNVLCARMITDACGLPPCNVLSSAGGKFQILLPDTEKTRNSLTIVKKQVEKWAFERFFGELRLIITGGTPFSYEDFELTKFQNVFKTASDSLNIEKQKPFSDILSNSEKWIDEQRYPYFQKNKICSICGKEPGFSETERVGYNCKEFVAFGNNIRKNLFVTVFEKNEGPVFGKYSVKTSNEDDIAIDELHSIYRINLHREKNSDKTWPELHYSSFYPEKEIEDENEVNENDLLLCKTFEEMAKGAEGLNALAVLKADVDNMGMVFKYGLKKPDGKSLLTVSRMVSMSRMLNWFFAGYLPQYICKCENDNDKYGNIYTLFAGGDDLCLIGPWNIMIDFADKIQREFTSFTGEAPCITLSAGIELFKPKYPVVHAVENAESNLEKSKSNIGKNSVTVFGHTMKWKEEFESQLNFAFDWAKFVDSGKEEKNNDRSSILYRLLSYHNNYKENIGKITALKHRFQIIYDISRNIDEKWYSVEPFKTLLSTKVENTNTFLFLPVGISIASYKKREKGDAL